MIDRLVRIEVWKDDTLLTDTHHRCVPSVNDRALTLTFEPELPQMPGGSVLLVTWQGQELTINLASVGL